MKKNLLYVFGVLCLLGIFTGCKDEKEPETPPTVEDIVAEYSAENLKPTIEGVDVDVANVKIELAKSTASDKVTIILYNVVPGAPEFKIPDAEFAATTRSAYVSTLKGEVTDNVIGYNVKVDGTVDDKVLTVKVVLTEVEAENTNTSSLYNLVYKGNMDINVGNIPTPISMEQRVYITKARKIGTTQRDTSMVKLTIKKFAFQGLELGDIALDTVLVQKRGEVLVFKASERKIVLSAIGEVTANMQGTIVDNNIKLTLDIDASGLQVNVAFNGPSVAESKVAKIENMTIESNAILEQKKTISNLTLKVWGDVLPEQLLLTPKYTLSEKATVDSIILHRKGEKDIKLSQEQVEGKQPIDFSLLQNGKDDYIKYFLAAEDPNTKGSFILYVERIALITPVYDMQTWVEDEGNNMPTPKGLTNSNLAAAFFPMLGIDVPTPVVESNDKAAEITTSRTVSQTSPNGMVPGITAGTLFLGTFELNPFETLKSTHFGVPYKEKPVNFKITYKYTPGTTFYKTVTKNDANDTEIVEGAVDECSINAYLYEVSSYEETLDGTNINTSKKVIMKAVLADGNAKDAYQNVTIPFLETGNGTFDSSKKYKLAIVCSSSKKGDEFMGADGSKLWVKYLEVTH